MFSFELSVVSSQNTDNSRHIKDLRARFAIADDSEVTFLLFDDDQIHPTYDVGVWVNTPFFAGALKQLFDVAWEDLEVVKVKQ